MIYKLLKALYGLIQSPDLWYKQLLGFFFEKFGLIRINADHSIFDMKKCLDIPFISMFVDDIKIIAPRKSGAFDGVKQELTFTFSMVDLGLISFYLGLKVQRNWEKQMIKLFLSTNIDKVFSKFYLNKAYIVNTSIKETAFLEQKIDGEASVSMKKRYQAMTWSIIFFMVKIRPDIVFATSIVSRCAQNLGHQYTKAVKTIFHYCKGSK